MATSIHSFSHNAFKGLSPSGHSSYLKRQILDSSKQKEVADDTFKFDENGKSSKNG